MLSAFVLWLFFIFFLSPAHAFTITKTPQHYAQEMEVYYQHPRPESLAGILVVFSNAGILANAKKRLFLAAFLSELVKAKQLDLQNLLDKSGSVPEARATLAWIAHLAGYGQAKVAILLESQNKILLDHILATPADLEAWDPALEQSVVDMYWGAFMATGKQKWLESIIDVAILHADSGHVIGRYAAATLYEYIPRHEKITVAIRRRMPKARPAQVAMFEKILANAN